MEWRNLLIPFMKTKKAVNPKVNGLCLLFKHLDVETRELH
nr:MAG TPA: hypothetical protein [Caudoviricetes sp.]